MDRVEKTNLQQIEMLNQRGGLTLSIVDLMRAGTISPEMAAYAFCAIRGGASFLTAARPGGAGKTTLMAALLSFLPPGERLRTVGVHASRVPRGNSDHGHECLLCHEIGRGLYFGYLWGREAQAFFHAISRAVRIASNIHADTMAEVREELSGPDIAVDELDFCQIGFLAFMTMRGSGPGRMRRVASLHASSDSGHRLLWEWDETSDTFAWKNGGSPEDFLPPDSSGLYGDAVRFLQDLKGSGETAYASARRQVLNYCDGKQSA